MAPGLSTLHVCACVLALALLSRSAPAIHSNVTDHEPLGKSMSGSYDFIPSERENEHMVPTILHSRSPMDPMDLDGPSSSQSQPHEASGLLGAPSILASASSTMGILRKYEERGRNFFLLLTLVDANQVKHLLDVDRGLGTWGGLTRFSHFLHNGWTQQDLSQSLTGNRFMDRLTTISDHLVVGQADETLVLHAERNNALRHSSIKVWPEGPNRLIRMIHNGNWGMGSTSIGVGSDFGAAQALQAVCK